MKKSLIFLGSILSLTWSQVSAQSIRATIKPGTANSTVDIYIRPDFTDNAQFLRNLILTVAIPTAQASGVTATITPAASGINSLNYVSEPVEVFGTETVYAFNGTASNGSMTFTNGVEILAATITFSGGIPRTSQIKLADYTGAISNTGATSNALFYAELNAFGDVTPASAGSGLSIDDFYATPSQSTVGSNVVGGSPNNGFSQTINNVGLPVQLLSFTAQKAGDTKTLIHWATTSTSTVAAFEVERSATGLNGSYTTIATQAPQSGNGSASIDYKAYDAAPLNGVNYYRLKTTGITGEVTYSAVQEIRFNTKLSTESVRLFPNPLTADTREVKVDVTAQSNQTMTYLLSDLTGRVIYQGQLNVTAGQGQYALQGFDGLSTGTYFVQVKGTSLTQTIKVIKTN